MSPSPETVMDVNVQAQSPPDSFEDDDDVTVEDVISAFLAVNPTPTDDQIHTLAALLNTPFDEFEDVIYEMFSDFVDDPEGYADEVEDALDELAPTDDETEEDDPVEVLLVCFFAFHQDPTDVEIHQLAGLIDMTPEQLEEVLYELLARAGGTSGEEATSDPETEYPYQMDQLHTP